MRVAHVEGNVVQVTSRSPNTKLYLTREELSIGDFVEIDRNGYAIRMGSGMGLSPVNLLNNLGFSRLANQGAALNQGSMQQYVMNEQQKLMLQQMLSNPPEPGKIQRIDQDYYEAKTLQIPKKWYDRIGAVGYDINCDVAIMATGERVTHRAVEDGYIPPRSNVEWLDRQVNMVRVKL